MNIVPRLRAELTRAQATLSAQAEVVQELRVRLGSDRIAGVDQDGSRRDWIAVSDVHAWLACIVAAGG